MTVEIFDNVKTLTLCFNIKECLLISAVMKVCWCFHKFKLPFHKKEDILDASDLPIQIQQANIFFCNSTQAFKL